MRRVPRCLGLGGANWSIQIRPAQVVRRVSDGHVGANLSVCERPVRWRDTTGEERRVRLSPQPDVAVRFPPVRRLLTMMYGAYWRLTASAQVLTSALTSMQSTVWLTRRPRQWRKHAQGSRSEGTYSSRLTDPSRASTQGVWFRRHEHRERSRHSAATLKPMVGSAVPLTTL